jgi:hypothetical protein
MELRPCKEILLKTQWGITGCFHEQRDMVRVVEKDARKRIDPIAVGGGDAIARVWGRIRRMHTGDGSSFKREIGDPIPDYSIHRTPTQVTD